MTKKIAILVLTFICSASVARGATSYMGGEVLNAWQVALQVSGSLNALTNDIMTVPDGGVRLGLLGNLELGVRVYKLGLTTDLKYVFLRSFPFSMALDFELAFASVTSLGAAIILDLELNSFTDVYLTARWRYPSPREIDISDQPTAGMTFLSRFGIEILRRSFLTFNVEFGIVASWASTQLGYNAGAMITWKLN